MVLCTFNILNCYIRCSINNRSAYTNEGKFVNKDSPISLVNVEKPITKPSKRGISAFISFPVKVCKSEKKSRSFNLDSVFFP